MILIYQDMGKYILKLIKLKKIIYKYANKWKIIYGNYMVWIIFVVNQNKQLQYK